MTTLSRFSAITLTALLAGCMLPHAAAGQRGATGAYGFTENKGQYADLDGNPVPFVLYRSSAGNADVYITTSGITYVLKKHTWKETAPSQDEAPRRPAKSEWCRVDMELRNASLKRSNIVEEQAEPGISNYYYGHCPQGITGVRTFKKITVKDVYPGIDWVLYADDAKGLKYDLVIHPGADVSTIKLHYKGAEQIKLANEARKLEVKAPFGVLHEGSLYSYEESTKHAIASHYVLNDDTVMFALSNYDRTETIIIDPPLLWDGSYGGGNTEMAYAAEISKDAAQDLLIAGDVDGTGFPVTGTNTAFQGTFGNGTTPYDAFVARLLNSSGARVFSTYFGGNKDEGAKGISSDNTGNAYVTGYVEGTPTSNTFPKTSGTLAGGVFDIFCAKFSPTGARLWAIPYGGTGSEQGFAIVTNGSTGNSYVTGFAGSPNGTFYTGGSTVNDVFVMKLNNAGAKQYAVKHGGGDDDKGRSIALNSAATSIYIGGSTISSNFPTTAGVFQTAATSDLTFNGSSDGIILKVDEATGATRQFSTYCGGDFGDDQVQGIAVDASNNVYVTGFTLSPSFPTTNPGAPAYFNNTSTGTHDAFVLECNSGATARVWSTYFCGSSTDMGYGIVVDGLNNVFITGSTSSTDFPVQIPSDNVYYQSVQGDAGGSNDAFIAWFTGNKQLRWSTFYGGAGNDEGRAIVLDGTNSFVSGTKNNNAMALKFGPGTVLPIELLSFTGKHISKGNLLQWITATETNNQYFTIERASDNMRFRAIGQVAGAVNSTSILHYDFLDDAPPAGVTYYRLKQTDTDGNYEYSPVIAIAPHDLDESTILLFPDPAVEEITVTYSNSSNEPGTLSIISAQGKRVLERPLQPGRDNTFFTVNIHNLPEGIYLLSITQGEHVQQKKFIKN